MPTQTIPLEGIAEIGLIQDMPASTLPAGAWTDALNVRFRHGAIRRMGPHADVFGSIPSINNIRKIAYWENPNVRCYVIVNRETAGDVVYLASVDGQGRVETSAKGTFMHSDSWQVIQFNGGYSIIVNNGVEAPRHISVQIGGSANISSIANFAALPNWESYAQSGSVLPGFAVNAEIVLPFGNLMLAAALTERSSPSLPAITGFSNPPDGDNLTVVFASAPGLSAGDTFQIINDPNYEITYTQLGNNTLEFPPVNQTATVASPYNQQYTVASVETGTEFIVTPTTAIASIQDGLAYPNVAFDTTGDSGNGAYGTINLSSYAPSFGRTSGASASATVYNTSSGTDKVNRRDLNGVVRASSVAAPGAIPNNWNPFASGAGTADEINLANTGQITAMKELRGNPFVFTSDTITQLRVSSSGLSAIPISNEYGALTDTGVVGFQGTLVVVGSDDIYLFSGNPGDIKSIAEGRVREAFYEDLHSTYFRNMMWIRNQEFDELWLCYPSVESVSGELTDVLVWNYRNNTWTRRELPANTYTATVGPIPGTGGGRRDEIILNNGLTELDLTVTNPNGQSVNLANITADFASNLANQLDGQAGFSAYHYKNVVYVTHTPKGKSGQWSYSLEHEGIAPTINTDVAGMVDAASIPFQNFTRFIPGSTTVAFFGGVSQVAGGHNVSLLGPGLAPSVGDNLRISGSTGDLATLDGTYEITHVTAVSDSNINGYSIRFNKNSMGLDESVILNQSNVTFELIRAAPVSTSDARPWSIGVLNEAKNYVVLGNRSRMNAVDVRDPNLGAWTMSPFVSRHSLHFAPEKDTEALTSMYFNVDPKSGQTFDIEVLPQDRAGTLPTFSTADPVGNFSVDSDYKHDVRVTSRLVALRIQDSTSRTSPTNDNWAIASVDLEVGKRGTR